MGGEAVIGRTLIILLLIVIGACRSTEPDPETTRQRALLAEEQKKLAAVERAVRQPLPGPAGCAEPTPDSAGGAALVDADYLGYLAGKGGNPYTGPGARYALLTASRLKNPELVATGDGKALLDRLFALKRLGEDYRYYAVAVVREKRLPALRDEGFSAGRLAGDLVLVRLRDGSVVCSTPFEAQSSAEVASVGGGRAEAIDRDFDLRIRRGLENALARLDKGVSLDLR